MEKEDQAHDIRPRYKGVCEACQGDLYTCKIIAQAAEPYIPGHETRQDCGFSPQQILNQGFERETWENFIAKMKGGRQNGNEHERL